METLANGSNAFRIATENFAGWLGIELVSEETDKVEVRLPYQKKLGEGRIHGGAICALIDVAATAAFWSHPRRQINSRSYCGLYSEFSQACGCYQSRSDGNSTQTRWDVVHWQCLRY